MSTGKVYSARSRGGQRRTTGVRYDVRTAKARTIEFIEAGLTVQAAMDKVGRSVKTYEYWRRTDPDFKARVDLAMQTRKVDDSSREGYRRRAREMGFAAWRKEYLGQEVPWHQQQWVDLLEGREPRDLHPAQIYERGRKNRIIITTPPYHGKSITLTVDYATYRICCDPSVRIRIVSKTATLASQFLGAIKMRLTHPRYAKLIEHFAPEGGFKATAESWTQDQIFLDIMDRDGIEKDPTVQAAGIGKQIYGTRADLIILDDCVDLENSNQHEKQRLWLTQEVESRLGPGGTILIIGTRVNPIDLYRELRNGEHYASGKSPWTYLSQPAILEEVGEPKDWVTLWPKALDSWGEDCDCGTPECREGYGDGYYPRWDGVHLARMRDGWDPRRFALVFQQTEVDEDATFPHYAVAASINNRRRWGKDGGLDRVPDGCYWIGSLDPATSGHAAGIVYAVDPRTRRRYVVDAANIKAPTPLRLKQLIKSWSVEYPIREWRVEKTGLLTMFTQDAELRAWLAGHGIVFKPHYTGTNKWDAEFGVASMAPLFGSWDRTEDGEIKCIVEPIIELPRLDKTALRTLVAQLESWSPELDPKRTPCDLVMALWFAEVGAREVLKSGQRGAPHFQRSKWLTPAQRAKQRVINLADYISGTVW